MNTSYLISKFDVLRKMKNCLESNKLYFLKKRINEYGIKLQHHSKWKISKIIDFERKWKYLNKKYQQIYIYGIEFVGIGETIPRLFEFIKNNKKKKKEEFHIVLPIFFSNYSNGVFNNKIFEIFGNDIYFITKENIDFWLYLVLIHSRKINITYFDMYKYREAKKIRLDEKDLIPFLPQMVAYAKNRMKEMGIEKDYICIHARESSTKTNNYYFYPDTSVSDVDVNSFKKACNYLQKENYQIIRMGKDEIRRCEIPNVIDYANKYYDEFMDFYLIANCKFLIGSLSGLTSITPFWGKSVLVTNYMSFCYGYESLAVTDYDMCIPKKFYSKNKEKYLNLYEMLIISNRCDRYKERFDREGIVVIDNTQEEILKATIEMNEKINGRWRETKEEQECMEKYWKILNLWMSRHKTSIARKETGAYGYQMICMPICYSYLKDNLWLLEVKELE